jgi:negative regulator of sigma E activity
VIRIERDWELIEMSGSLDHSTSADHEQLVAYLDGELTPAEAQQVERRLSRDEGFRQLLKGLQEAWDMLDELPQPTVDDSFTQTTVEMVAVRMSDEVGRDQQRMRHRKWLGYAMQGTLVAASLVLGFWGVRHWQKQSDLELLRDLSVIEHVDLYNQLVDLAFLENLAATDVFPEPVNEDQPSETP